MDYQEAETILRRHAEVYKGWTGQKFAGLGATISLPVDGASGRAYLFVVDVTRLDDRAGEHLEVEFVVTPADGRRWLPKQVSADIYLKPSDSWDGTLPNITRQ